MADNRTNEEASWDTEALALELASLKLDEFDLDLTGFNLDEIQELLADTTEGFTDEEQAPALPAFAVTESGDLWILGKHRLLCGDATSSRDVERLMDAQKAELVFTDPPYNFAYDHEAGRADRARTGEQQPGGRPRSGLVRRFRVDAHRV